MRKYYFVIGVLALVLGMASQLLAGNKHTTLVWEAEQVKLSGKTFVIKKYTDDPSGPVLSKKVLAVPNRHDEHETVAQDEVMYTVRVPQDGTYYLWARTFWSADWLADASSTDNLNNSFFIKVGEAATDPWVLGEDDEIDELHWVCLLDTQKGAPRSLQLTKGTVSITLGVRESGVMVDQFMLTTDPAKKPAGGYRATQDVLELDMPEK